MMQAVMAFSLAEFWSLYGRLFVVFAGNHNPGGFDVSIFAFNVENGVDGSRGMLNIVLTC
jgi:hypothetical protein